MSASIKGSQDLHATLRVPLEWYHSEEIAARDLGPLETSPPALVAASVIGKPTTTSPGVGSVVRALIALHTGRLRLSGNLGDRMIDRAGKFRIGQVVRHRRYPFRGVVFDVDPTFANTEEWWLAIPEDVRPRREQPYYHLLAENAETTYVAYVSEQNLLPDESGEPVRHPQVAEVFGRHRDGFYELRLHRGH